MPDKAPSETGTTNSQPLPAVEIQFDCVGCNAPLRFAPGTTKLVCSYCGSGQEIERPSNQDGPGQQSDDANGLLQASPDSELEERVREYDFATALEHHSAKSHAEGAALVEGGHEIRCEDCGAQAVLAGQAGHCPYCDGPVVVQIKGSADRLAPDSVLPFAIDRKAAEERFTQWVKGLWFAPGDLEKRASRDEIDGVYLPYWTYDSITTNLYRGERGEDYWETEWYTDSSGQRSQRRKLNTRWSFASGTVRISFDDVLVYASDTLPRPLIEKLEPWDLNRLEVFDPAYLSGFIAERYRIDLETGFANAEERMKRAIHQAVCRDIGGDRQRVRSLDIEHGDVAFRHCLLPLWISSFRYNGKVYRFLVNAQTGEISGERPISWIRVALLFLLVSAIFMLAVNVL